MLKVTDVNRTCTITVPVQDVGLYDRILELNDGLAEVWVGDWLDTFMAKLVDDFDVHIDYYLFDEVDFIHFTLVP